LIRDDFVSDMTPEMCRDVLNYIQQHRSAKSPFDFALKRNTLPKDRAEDYADAEAYEKAGVTWWVEGISPWRFGWQSEGSWPLAAMRDRVLMGPPRG
jgi:hypothetical protein